MDIQKAIEHLDWKFRNVWKPSEKDIEALNSIIMFKKQAESKNLLDNDALAKLWIHQLILLNRSNLYNGERSIQVIDEILSKTVYEWCQILHKEMPMMRFNGIGIGKYQIDTETVLNRTKMNDINKNIVSEFETELTEALKYEISEDKIISFVETQITRILNDF